MRNNNSDNGSGSRSKKVQEGPSLAGRNLNDGDKNLDVLPLARGNTSHTLPSQNSSDGEVKNHDQDNGGGNSPSKSSVGEWNAYVSHGDGSFYEDPKQVEAPSHKKEQQVNSPCLSQRRKWQLVAVLAALALLAVGFGIGMIMSSRNTGNGTSSSSSSSTANVDVLTPDDTPPLVIIDSPTGVPAVQEDVDEDLLVDEEVEVTTTPTTTPSARATYSPTVTVQSVTQSPTAKATLPETESPSFATASPTNLPIPATTSPTIVPPTSLPTMPPTASVAGPGPETEKEQEQLAPATYIPGNLTHIQVGILLSEGLNARLIATAGKPVQYHDGSVSQRSFHSLPDAGATFPDPRPGNEGGWVYVSNSEHNTTGLGSVGALTFDASGNVIDYKMVLENTTRNCGGGRTPWNTWVSCEEIEFHGKIYQVDPLGQRPAEMMTLGSDGGRWESFAFDVRNRNVPHFFATEDHNKGTVRRFTPDVLHWDSNGDEWKMLHETGLTDYLIVSPNEERTGGTFSWTTDLEAARNNARSYYPQSEGIDVHQNQMFVVCKKIKQIFTFDLDSMTYHNVSTVSGLFDGGPDQMQRILGEEGGLLYFTEEGGVDAGIHARDELGRFFTILESPVYTDETTGLSFSPDGKYMYVAYQDNGLLFQVWRDDGHPFQYKSLDVKYHSMGTRRLNSQWIGL